MNASDLVAIELTRPTFGYHVWFETNADQHVWFRRWYGSLKAARIACTKMHLVRPIIVGKDGIVK